MNICNDPSALGHVPLHSGSTDHSVDEAARRPKYNHKRKMLSKLNLPEGFDKEKQYVLEKLI